MNRTLRENAGALPFDMKDGCDRVLREGMALLYCVKRMAELEESVELAGSAAC